MSAEEKSSDDPKSAEYANQREIDRLNKLAAEATAEANRLEAEKKAGARDFALQFGVAMDQYASDHYAVVEESNKTAKEAIAALRDGEPLQDGELPDQPELPVSPTDPRPEQQGVIPSILLSSHLSDPDPK